MAERRRNNSLDLMRCSQLGLQLGASIVVFTFAGYWLDQWLDSSPVLLIAGACLGAAAGMWYAVKAVERLDEPPPTDPRSGSDEQP